MAKKREGWDLFGVRRSPVYKVLGILPTPVRPWIMGFEALAALKLRSVEYKHHRREASLERQLERAQRKRGGLGLGRLIVGAGVAYAVSRYLEGRDAQKPGFRISGFVNDALDRVQEASDAGFARLRGR